MILAHVSSQGEPHYFSFMIGNREGTLVLYNRSYCLTPACYMFGGGFVIYFHNRKLFKDSLTRP